MKKSKIALIIVIFLLILVIFTGCEEAGLKVTFNSLGGSAVINQTLSQEGGKATEPDAPTRKGYIFGGWYMSKDCNEGEEFDFNTEITQRITLYAKWTEQPNPNKTYIINFKNTDGTLISQQTVRGGDKASLPQSPTKGDDYFVGWYKDLDLTQPFDFDTVISYDFTLYPKFVALTAVTSFEWSQLYNGTYEVKKFIGRETEVAVPLEYDGKAVTSIGSWAFAGCTQLTNITIPNGVISIGHKAFDNCTSLISITIPNSVTSIDSYAFYGCTKLVSITVAQNNEHYKSINGNLYTKDGKTLIQYAVGKTDVSFSISNSVTSIDDSAFYGCSSLTSITIPDSVTSIGSWAFAYCTNLTSITIPNSVTSIGDGAFSRCTNLTSITIGNSVTSIGDGAFSRCTNLTSITIPNIVTRIDDSAFYGCSSLTSITIPDSVTSIGSWAFAYCTNLTSITIPNSVISIGDLAFSCCTNLTIFCEATSKPSEWDNLWNIDNRSVYWAGQWHYDSNGNPTPN